MTAEIQVFPFTYNGETRLLSAGEIRRWTGLKMATATIRDNLEFVRCNLGDARYPLLAYTPHGMQVAGGYRDRIARAKSIEASRRSPFAGRAAC